MSPTTALIVVVVVAIVALFSPSTAFADSAGPTNYETTILDVAPDADGAVTFSIEGGDSFVRARVAAGHSLVVLGYDGEPYIRVDPDGAVFENRRSESYYYNLERFGGDVPPDADSTAEPNWVEVDGDGEHAWHDHRAHWMAEVPLVGLEPGQSLPSDEIAVVVDGTPTVVLVSTQLQSRASPWWAVAGFAIGLGAAGAAIRRPRGAGMMVGLVGTSTASIAGIAHALSVPASTGRPLWWWLPPLVGVATMAIAVAFRNDKVVAGVLLMGVGVELVVWSALQMGGLTDAYRPTTLPVHAERIIVAALPVVGVGLVVGALRVLATRRAHYGVGSPARN